MCILRKGTGGLKMNGSILDTVRETCQLFSKYELTKGELA